MRRMLFGGLVASEPALLFKRRHFWHREGQEGRVKGLAPSPARALSRRDISGNAMLHTIAAFDRLGEENAFAVLARATALANQGRDIVNLGIGQPDFPTPPHI